MSYKHSLILHMSNETFCVIFKHCETRGFYGISTDPWPLLPNLFDSITSTRTTEAFLLHMSSSSSSRVRQSFFADMDERETLLPKKLLVALKFLLQQSRNGFLAAAAKRSYGHFRQTAAEFSVWTTLKFLSKYICFKVSTFTLFEIITENVSSHLSKANFT